MFSKPIKVSFIGAGNMAREHAKAFRDDSNFTLVGVHSKNITSAKKFAQEFGLSFVAKDINELYYSTKSEVIVVAVPELILPEVLDYSFQYPWVHLLEKPVGINAKISTEILALQNKLNATAFVGLNRRFYSGMMQLKSRLDSLNENRVLIVHDQENQMNALRSGQPEEVVKNWAFANSIHLIDLFSYLCRGEVNGVSTTYSDLSKNSLFIHSKINFTSGDLGIYNGIWNDPGPWSLACYLPGEYWEMKPLETTSRRTADNKAVKINQTEWDLRFKPGLRMQVQEIFNYFSSKSCKLPTIYDANISMNLVHKIYDRL